MPASAADMRASAILCLVLLAFPSVAQQIWDIWQTTWDRSKLFTSLSPSSPINFVIPGAIGSADIVVNDGTTYQSIVGFGGSLTDTSALTLNNLKTINPANYWKVLQHMFTMTDGANAAGLNYVRLPLGSSDFSSSVYSLDDVSGDTSFSKFDINNIPSYVFSVLSDIQSTNSLVKLHLVPWSPPAWMKDGGTMNGGSLKSEYVSFYSTYLLKAVQGFQSKGFPIYSTSVQNEPQNSNPTYPTCMMTYDVEGQIATSLRSQLDSNGLSGVKIIGYEHNWDNAATYPVELMGSYADAFTGAAFHCYAGSVSNQDSFHNAYPSKAVYFTECSGTIGSDWWSDIKWYMDNLWIGSLEHYSQSGLMWNIAADGNGNPKLPATDSCGGNGCRPMVTVNSDGTYTFNQEFYSMAQASKAIIPKDSGGPYGQRIDVTIGGSLSWALRVSAFVTGRVSSSDSLRYSIVVMNWDDSASTTWNPQSVKTTIEFRGMQATYTFPVGVTTLWWFAPNTGHSRRCTRCRTPASSEAVKLTTSNITYTGNETSQIFTRINK
ncbi:glycoside hydrolase family 30 protein [Hypholoma sublateritium FD-334 SS-4]|uniref:Glycoside hydrolase family 30 protein n=1 Tax=Hypholoma sublateritium (strain FD-334 SS-4) TaxID=945553 RepID=A0A0D2LD79_HYPSF|nr:glycoside hydrolase family 30 protein [Hypholoma sublateritium FD-334 SS-4]